MWKPGIFWQRENHFEQQLEASGVHLRSSLVPFQTVSSFFVSSLLLFLSCKHMYKSRQPVSSNNIGDGLLLVLLRWQVEREAGHLGNRLTLIPVHQTHSNAFYLYLSLGRLPVHPPSSDQSYSKYVGCTWNTAEKIQSKQKDTQNN